MSGLSEEFATLTLRDGKGGVKEVKLPILRQQSDSEDVPLCLDIRSLQSHGIYTYDPGFTSTASCSSSITYIDGPAGVLLHRGYHIEDLAAHCSYLELCYLLLNGELPSTSELDEFTMAINTHTLLHEKLRSFFQGFKDGAHPMAIMTGVVGSLR